MKNMTSNSEVKFGLYELLQWLAVAEMSTLGVVILATAAFVHVLMTVTRPRQYKPRMFYKQSTLSRHLLRTVPHLTRAYVPPAWASNGHLQTLLILLLPKNSHIRLEREYLQLKDEGVVTLDWAETATVPSECGAGVGAAVGTPPPIDPRASVVIFLPGMLGMMNVVYDACHQALVRGYRPVIFHSRGAPNTPLTTARVLSLGDTSDFRQAVRYVQEKWPEAKLLAIGFGLMGSGLLFSYLGEYGSSTNLCAAVVVSPAWDAPALFDHCPQPYGWLELWLWKKALLENAGPLHEVIDLRTALRCRTLSELSECMFFAAYGYTDNDEFWDKNSPLRDVDDIAVPLLAIQSTDDPIVGQDSIPYELFDVYPNLFLVTTERGGHCAFLEGDALESWSLKLSFDYLQSVSRFVEIDAKERNKLSNGKG